MQERSTHNFCLFEKVFIYPLVLKDNFTAVILFSQYFKYFTLLSSCLYGFWGKVECNSHLCFSVSKVFFSFVFFQNVFFSFDFLSFEYHMPGYSYFLAGAFILLGVLWYFWVCALVSDINLRKFSVISISNIYFIPFFLSPLSDTLCICYTFCSFPTIWIVYGFFQSLFSLLFNFGGFYWYIMLSHV